MFSIITQNIVFVKVLFRKSISEADDQQKFQAVAYAVKDFIVSCIVLLYFFFNFV